MKDFTERVIELYAEFLRGTGYPEEEVYPDLIHRGSVNCVYHQIDVYEVVDEDFPGSTLKLPVTGLTVIASADVELILSTWNQQTDVIYANDENLDSVTESIRALT